MGLRRVIGDILALVRATIRYVISLRQLDVNRRASHIHAVNLVNLNTFMQVQANHNNIVATIYRTIVQQLLLQTLYIVRAQHGGLLTYRLPVIKAGAYLIELAGTHILDVFNNTLVRW